MIFQDGNFFSSLSPTFLSQAIFSALIFFLGLSFGSVIKIAVLSSKNRRRASIFSSLCVFLAFSAILYTVLIFMSGSFFPLPQFQKSLSSQGISKHFYYIFIVSIFFWGSLVAVFWKIMLPLSLVLYFGLFFFTNHLLQKKFGEQPASLSFRIEETSPSEIKIIAFSLPDIALLPVGRTWLLINESIPPDSFHDSKSPLVKHYLNFLLTRGSEQITLPLPKSDVYPSLYTILINFHKGQPSFELVRTL